MSGTSTNEETRNTSGLSLPAYILLRSEGVFVNLSPPPAQDILQLFVDRLFTHEARFAGLDYACFLELLFGSDIKSFSANASEVRIASSILRFPPERMELYKSLKIMNHGERAEFMFEPTFIEIIKEEPVFGEPGEDGIRPVIDLIRNKERQATQLDFDEFVASMWVKGVRFGIDADAVREEIRKGSFKRMTVACQREAEDSRDAEVVEESDHLRIDNAPLILPNGKADLRRAKNRFPQVAKGVVLLRKIPRLLGRHGYTVAGMILEARIPLDIDLKKLAGEGTRIDITSKGEVIVAAMDGFLYFDEHTSAISITEKVENRIGISAKGTGDVKLAVEHYIEHGEVQEWRVVEGKHMTFRSDVFGNVLSQGGDIELNNNISGGRAQSEGGNISVRGKVINTTLEAWDGKIMAEFAEGSLIMGKSVVIGRVVNCEIVAEEVQLGVVEGCAIGGKKIQIISSSARRHREVVISILLPNIASLDKQIAEAKHSLAQIEHALQAKNRELVATQADPAFTRYLDISSKVRAGKIKFTPEQQAGWQKIVNQFAPIVRGTDGMMKKCIALEEAIEKWTQERAVCGEGGEYCRIETVKGETVVKKINSNLGMAIFRNLPQPELRSKLKLLGTAEMRLFSDHHGSLDWHFTLAEKPEA